MSHRYFIAGLHKLDIEEQERLNSDSSAPAAEVTPPTPSENDNSGETQGPMTFVNSLLRIARSGTSSSSSSAPVTTQPAYLELPPSDDSDNETFYTVNTTPSENVLCQSEQKCPDNLEDMLQIVRDLRHKRRDELYCNLPVQSSIVTPAQQDRREAMDNASNLIRLNMDDFYD